jgi:hypothetical protein
MTRPMPERFAAFALTDPDACSGGSTAPPKAAAPKAPAPKAAAATRRVPRWPDGSPIELPAGLTPAQRRSHLGSLRMSSAREMAQLAAERREWR